MKYTLISIDDSRAEHKPYIHKAFDHLERVEIQAVDASSPEALREAQQKHRYNVHTSKWMARRGHLGVFYSVLNAMDEGEIITIEDDAIIGPNFKNELWLHMRELPDDTDCFSLFIPRDSDHMYHPKMEVGNRICKMYAHYGGVSMYWSDEGIDKFKWLLLKDGITNQWDGMVYNYAKRGFLNGYTSKPEVSDLVTVSSHVKSIVQETDRWRG